MSKTSVSTISESKDKPQSQIQASNDLINKISSQCFAINLATRGVLNEQPPLYKNIHGQYWSDDKKKPLFHEEYSYDNEGRHISTEYVDNYDGERGVIWSLAAEERSRNNEREWHAFWDPVHKLCAFLRLSICFYFSDSRRSQLQEEESLGMPLRAAYQTSITS